MGGLNRDSAVIIILECCEEKQDSQIDLLPNEGQDLKISENWIKGSI